MCHIETSDMGRPLFSASWLCLIGTWEILRRPGWLQSMREVCTLRGTIQILNLCKWFSSYFSGDTIEPLGGAHNWKLWRPQENDTGGFQLFLEPPQRVCMVTRCTGACPCGQLLEQMFWHQEQLPLSAEFFSFLVPGSDVL